MSSVEDVYWFDKTRHNRKCNRTYDYMYMGYVIEYDHNDYKV